jgi:hypothetical protein
MASLRRLASAAKLRATERRDDSGAGRMQAANRSIGPTLFPALALMAARVYAYGAGWISKLPASAAFAPPVIAADTSHRRGFRDAPSCRNRRRACVDDFGDDHLGDDHGVDD